jgi:hypothetical protein
VDEMLADFTAFTGCGEPEIALIYLTDHYWNL